MAERDSSARPRGLAIADVAGPIAAFNVAVFLLVPVLTLHVVGGLGAALRGLSTFAGIAAALVLWASTWIATRRWLTGLDHADGFAWSDPPDRFATGRATRFCLRGSLWGGAIGITFLWILLTGLLADRVLVALLDGGLAGADVAAFTPTFVGLFLVVGYGLGGAIATVVGGVVGLVLAALDYAVLLLALRIARVGGSPAADSTDRPETRSTNRSTEGIERR